MDQADQTPTERIYQAVVGRKVLAAEMARQKQRKRGYDPLATEPVLKEHLNDEMLKICGRMSLCGAPFQVVRGVRTDMEKLLDLTVATLQAGHREQWDDLLPQPDENGLKVNASRIVTTDGPAGSAAPERSN